MKNCLVVLGMHRSGTSALTGLLDRLGVDLGDTLMDAAPDNPRGFFEDTFIVDTNDTLLSALDSSWDAPFALPADWQSRANDTQLREAASRFIGESISPDRPYALKDPRISRLLPWWQSLFDQHQVAARYVVLVRNPLEVAASLQERNGLSTAHSLLLWTLYMLDAQRYTRGYPRAFIHYDDLLRNPPDSIRRLYAQCGLPVPGDLDVTLDGFIEGGMRHHVADATAPGEDYPAPVAQLYEELSKMSRADSPPTDNPGLDELETQFHTGRAMYHSPELAQAFCDRRRLPENLEDFLSSPPWRLYRWYQGAVYRYLPEGTPVRRFLQRAKKVLRGGVE